MVGLIVALYLGGVVAHALFIWTDPIERLVALLTAVGMAALIVLATRRGSFAPRTVAELRADEPPGAGMTVAVVANGRGVSETRVANLGVVQAVAVDLPRERPQDIDVWAHRPTRDGDSDAIPVEVDLPDETHLVARPVGSWLPTA
jgi:hypothetical protein